MIPTGCRRGRGRRAGPRGPGRSRARGWSGRHGGCRRRPAPRPRSAPGSAVTLRASSPSMPVFIRASTRLRAMLTIIVRRGMVKTSGSSWRLAMNVLRTDRTQLAASSRWLAPDRHLDLGEHPLGQPGEQRVLVGDVVVERHRARAQLGRHPPHAQRTHALGPGDALGRVEDALARQRQVATADGHGQAWYDVRHAPPSVGGAKPHAEGKCSTDAERGVRIAA